MNRNNNVDLFDEAIINSDIHSQALPTELIGIRDRYYQTKFGNSDINDILSKNESSKIRALLIVVCEFLGSLVSDKHRRQSFIALDSRIRGLRGNTGQPDEWSALHLEALSTLNDGREYYEPRRETVKETLLGQDAVRKKATLRKMQNNIVEIADSLRDNKGAFKALQEAVSEIDKDPLFKIERSRERPKKPFDEVTAKSPHKNAPAGQQLSKTTYDNPSILNSAYNLSG